MLFREADRLLLQQLLLPLTAAILPGQGEEQEQYLWVSEERRPITLR